MADFSRKEAFGIVRRKTGRKDMASERIREE